jgi:hypothetical protein
VSFFHYLVFYVCCNVFLAIITLQNRPTLLSITKIGKTKKPNNKHQTLVPSKNCLGTLQKPTWCQLNFYMLALEPVHLRPPWWEIYFESILLVLRRNDNFLPNIVFFLLVVFITNGTFEHINIAFIFFFIHFL